MPNSKNMHIAVLAPIAAGKSTITSLIATEFDMTLMEEPVADNPFLPLFYQDAKKYGFVSQCAFFTKLFEDMHNVKDNPKVIYDSCLISNLVFVELMTMQNILKPYEAALLHTFAEKHIEILGHVDCYIVLKRPKEVLFANQRERNRAIEQDQEDYLNFHYDNYYKVLDRIIELYKLEEKIIFVELEDNRFDEANIDQLFDDIEDAMNHRIECEGDVCYYVPKETKHH